MASLRYLALGDSYTIGESVEVEDRWPKQLTRALNDAGIPISAPLIVAKTGWTTDELSEGIREAAPGGRFDLVTLLIGVNNQYRARPLDEYREQFRSLLETAVSFAGSGSSQVIVVSIPDWGVTPFASERDSAAIADAIDQFNGVNRSVAKADGVRYADITECSRRASSDPGLTASDGLHPSAAMYRLWTDLILPHAKAALSD